MEKFKAGDKIRMKERCGNMETGEEYILQSSRGFAVCAVTSGVEICSCEHKWELVKKNWDTLAIGDVILNPYGEEKEVLGRAGKMLFTGHNGKFTGKGTGKDYQESDWKIKDAIEDEVEVECEGNKVKISRKSAIALGLIK